MAQSRVALVRILDRERAERIAGIEARITAVALRQAQGVTGGFVSAWRVVVARIPETEAVQAGDLVEIPTTLPNASGDYERVDRLHAVLATAADGASIRLDCDRAAFG